MENSQICELIYQIYRGLRKQFIIKSNNQLTIFQIHILFFLKEKQSASTKEIANFFQLSLPATTLSLKKLIDEKLIKKEVLKKDERTKILKLTKKGEKLIKEINYKKMKNINSIINKLDQKEKKILIELLKKIVNN